MLDAHHATQWPDLRVMYCFQSSCRWPGVCQYRNMFGFGLIASQANLAMQPSQANKAVVSHNVNDSKFC